jgi:hypothetical protein
MKNKENESVGHFSYLQKCVLLKVKCAFCAVGIVLQARVKLRLYTLFDGVHQAP